MSILSLSANTAYWQTRFENSYRTLVCYKTVQGSSDGDAAATPNDPASIGPHGEFLPQFATTTRRDPGAPAGDPNAPPEGRVGPNEPENELFGAMYVGDNEEREWGLTVPAGNVGGEYEGDRVWRNAGLPSNSQVSIDSDLVGWEWDQIPSPASPLYAHAAEVEPEGVKRLSATNTSDPESTWLQDYGRERLAEPPPGQPNTVSAVEYRAASGAYVFASGTMQWAYGFDVDPAINQATYNVISEMGVQPATPESGIVLDSAESAQTAVGGVQSDAEHRAGGAAGEIRRLGHERSGRENHQLLVGPRRRGVHRGNRYDADAHARVHARRASTAWC